MINEYSQIAGIDLVFLVVQHILSIVYVHKNQ